MIRVIKKISQKKINENVELEKDEDMMLIKNDGDDSENEMSQDETSEE